MAFIYDTLCIISYTFVFFLFLIILFDLLQTQKLRNFMNYSNIDPDVKKYLIKKIVIK